MDRNEEFKVKHRRIAEYLDAAKLDAALLSATAHVAWLTCGGATYVNAAGDRGVCCLLATRDRVTLFTNRIERSRLLEEEFYGLDLEVDVLDWHADMESHILSKISGEAVRSDLPFGPLPLLDGDFKRVMYELTEPEIDRYRALGRDTGEALESVCRGIKPGMTENDIAARLAGACLERGIFPPVLLIAADERILKYRHPLPTSKPVSETAMVVVCGRRHGLIASATRMVHFGPLSADLSRRHNAVVKVDAVLNGLSRPGRTAGEVFRAAMEAYTDAGYSGEWNLHHQGGGAGYYGRYYFASENCAEPIGPRQGFAWNPSITGTKSEDTMLTLESGNEFITATGNWPNIEVSAGGAEMLRPDILVL